MSGHTARVRAGNDRASLYTEITDKIIAELEATLQWTVQRRPQAADVIDAWIGGTARKHLKAQDIFTLYTLG